MSATPNLATGQLLELLLTLKKTTPSAAKGILNAQPAIAYALITLMVSMNAINIEVFKKTLAEVAAQPKPGPSQPLAAPAPSVMHAPPPPPMPPYLAPSHSHSSNSTPIPAIPPHLQPTSSYNHYRTATPPHSTPTPPMAAPPPPPYGGYAPSNGYNTSHYAPAPPPPGLYGYQNYAPPAAPHTPAPPPALADTLAAIPDDQKALVLRIISMTPEQIYALPPQERSNYIQIRTTLGVPTPGS